jgi:multiple sugar transport system permease protein
MMNRQSARVLIWATLFGAAAYFLVPIAWLLLAATKSSEDLFSTFGLGFAANNQMVENIQTVLQAEGGIFLRWLGNSVVYVSVGAFLATYCAAAAGYALSRYDFRGKNAVFALIMVGMLVPATATALPLFFFFSSIGLADTMWSIILPSAVSPFGVFLCKVFADASVDKSLLEAARLDGAGEVRIFHVLGLRIMTPALVTVFLFQVVGIWNNYFLPLIMLTDEKAYPVTLGLNTWLSRVVRLPEYYPLTITGVLLAVIPLATAVLILQRFWRGGLTDGAVK